MSDPAMPARASVSAAGMRVVQLLAGKPPQTIFDLIRSTGLTRTAITEQLNDLVALGFVERTSQRVAGRGRPRHQFSLTRAALMLLFASNQRLLVPAIWGAISEVGGAELVHRVLDRVSSTLARHYRRKISGKTPRERLKQLARLLREEGVLLHVEEAKDGSLVVHKRNCPFISMYDETGAVCAVDLQMMKQVVGADVVRTACRHEGAPCCTFAIAPVNGRGK
ncbi:MAG: MarR family transcriptional regulator [Pirellulales bacterium]|nr:MarR family transcriptional regulator [Thermoguttaceae bacterium]MDD4789045.1 MarR family transcriptional regulator [Pirellulales bacterium]NLZ03105.1 MarR family transcriptional regulator [Pirellulaceae bacterium]